MPPINCPSCGRLLAPEMKFCHECGAHLQPPAPPPKPKHRLRTGCIVVIVLILAPIILIRMAAYEGSVRREKAEQTKQTQDIKVVTKPKAESKPKVKPKPKAESKSDPLSDFPVFHTQKGFYYASISKEWWKQAHTYSIRNDFKALQKLIDSNQVFYIKAGIPVYIEERSMFGRWKKIRPVGETVSLYTNYDAVK